MKAIGIVCEYNPFHNGHKYHIEQAKKLSGSDAAVCVMSGSFVQRGDIGVFDKWSRARTALENSADLVIELPVWYVIQSADIFAMGAIEILSKSHLADSISFGCENPDISAFIQCGQILAGEDATFKGEIKKLMGEGLGYPAALRLCIQRLYPYLENIVATPNNMLGANYISAMIKCGMSPEAFVPVMRHTAPHDSEISDGVYASSSQIRRILKDGGDPSTLTPTDTSLPRYRIENIESFILGFLRTCSPERIRNLPGIEDGFENRLISAAKKSSSLDELFENTVTKRYTLSRVRRTVLAATLGMDCGRKCDYVRILGMTDTGAALIKESHGKSELEFVTKTADFTPAAESTFNFDILATDIAALACDDESLRSGGRDFYSSPVKI